MEILEYSVRSLTPIVTGDTNKTNTKLLGTGLKGSLRYQYWLMKAMEKWVESPQGAHLLPYRAELEDADSVEKTHTKEEALREALRKAGPVVQLFGTTGWRPVFDMELKDCRRVWGRMPCSARFGATAPYQWEFFLRFKRNRLTRALDKIENQKGIPFIPENELQALMGFVHHWGWLGSAPQNGLGWVELSPIPRIQSALPSANPIFDGRDIFLTHHEFQILTDQLHQFYRIKLSSGTNRARYLNSMAYIAQDPPPIGYEIRRLLKYVHSCVSKRADWRNPRNIFKPVINNNNEKSLFGSVEIIPAYPDRGRRDEALHHSSHIHISHPLGTEDGYRLRIRICSRPDGGVVEGIIPGQFLDWCENFLKTLKV